VANEKFNRVLGAESPCCSARIASSPPELQRHVVFAGIGNRINVRTSADGRAAGSAPLHRAKYFRWHPVAGETISGARDHPGARLQIVGVKTIRVTAGGSASEMAANVSISDLSAVINFQFHF